MPKRYRRTQQYEKEISELKTVVLTRKEIGEGYLMILSIKTINKNFKL